jgi:hypothetical protein
VKGIFQEIIPEKSLSFFEGNTFWPKMRDYFVMLEMAGSFYRVVVPSLRGVPINRDDAAILSLRFERA